MIPGWTLYERERLIAMIGEGKHVTEIAILMNRTRNMIIGYARREDIKLNPKQGQRVRLRTLTKKTPLPKWGFKVQPSGVACEKFIEPKQIPAMTCQYLTDAKRRNFCGQPSHGSWCDKHRLIVFKPKKSQPRHVV
jgi:hypothetical protein